MQPKETWSFFVSIYKNLEYSMNIVYSRFFAQTTLYNSKYTKTKNSIQILCWIYLTSENTEKKNNEHFNEKKTHNSEYNTSISNTTTAAFSTIIVTRRV